MGNLSYRNNWKRNKKICLIKKIMAIGRYVFVHWFYLLPGLLKSGGKRLREDGPGLDENRA